MNQYGIHKNHKEIKSEYDYARKNKANYLLNVALCGDGSVHPSDKSTLCSFGNLNSR